MAQINRRLIILAVLCVLVILGLLIAVIVLASQKDKESNQGHQQVPPKLPSLLQVYGVTDGLDIKWFPNATDQADITKALKEGVQLLDIEVVKVGSALYNRGEELTLTHILQSLKSTETGMKIKLETSIETVTNAKEIIQETRDREFNNPVIITLPVFSRTFNWSQFLSDEGGKNDIMINFDLTADCCDTGIGRGTVEYVDLLYNQVKSNSFVEVDVGNLPFSWENVRWLLSKNEHLVLIISANSPINNDTVYDILTVRNDIDKNKVVYNIEDVVRTEFRHLASTAGSPLLYFDINPRDAGKIVWSHNTDTWDQLDKATSGDVMMIEGDIMLLDQDTPNQTNIPIMAHDIGDFNNITFEQWLDEIIKVDKGMKFDFKTLDAVRPALKIASKKRNKIKGPIWLNADILKGPKARETRIPATDFLDAIKEFPEATLSLGWTTVAKGTDYKLKYSMAMVQEMHNICKVLKQPVTFPVRAEQLVDSWNEFEWLLKQSRSYSLTVWTSLTDNVTRSDMDFVKQQAETSRVYFDLPEKWRPSF
ncbi:uncharacterized protein LOC123527471 [Mercenaria mercenaria]|uniref:uncharacterized protein LOC123527471 n=1 Tax=Mercenaria mercenaria TaxID=6596 RepID=UPI00234EB15F|nr:uncharacterized protein LOC123527471 [Mercenaria mercenaria]XP_053379358.1 uncharacterized protein LOC123527471 [Mercenaria mercenaria]